MYMQKNTLYNKLLINVFLKFIYYNSIHIFLQIASLTQWYNFEVYLDVYICLVYSL